MMGTREKMIRGSEYDALTRRGRRMVPFKRGVVARIKRGFWKRLRHDARIEAKRIAAEE
ncbi:MAG: hypothetical protein KGL11_10045 [Alphaproteobacteria bacterium]|nr:hypothetical protein [Alphaproteobacteria bacterium]